MIGDTKRAGGGRRPRKKGNRKRSSRSLKRPDCSEALGGRKNKYEERSEKKEDKKEKEEEKDKGEIDEDVLDIPGN